VRVCLSEKVAPKWATTQSFLKVRATWNGSGQIRVGRRMHEPLPEQGAWLRKVVRDFFAYHAVPTNWEALQAFRYHIERIWLRTLRRRSQKHRMTWDRMRKLADDWLPAPRILHPWPDQRFAVSNSRWEPRAGIPLARPSRCLPAASERWGNRPASLWIAEDLGCCASG
jgi:hypothetical protein